MNMQVPAVENDYSYLTFLVPALNRSSVMMNGFIVNDETDADAILYSDMVAHPLTNS